MVAAVAVAARERSTLQPQQTSRRVWPSHSQQRAVRIKKVANMQQLRTVHTRVSMMLMLQVAMKWGCPTEFSESRLGT